MTTQEALDAVRALLSSIQHAAPENVGYRCLRLSEGEYRAALAALPELERAVEDVAGARNTAMIHRISEAALWTTIKHAAEALKLKHGEAGPDEDAFWRYYREHGREKRHALEDWRSE